MNEAIEIGGFSAAMPEPECNTETIIRPSHHDKEITFLWTPGRCLAELLYRPGHGLAFAVKDGQKVSYSDDVRDLKPLSWVEEHARAGSVRLPSEWEEYDTLDHLAEIVPAWIHSYFDCDPIFESVATIYVLHTWIYERFHAVPYLRFLGLSGSGKTRATEAIGSICYGPRNCRIGHTRANVPHDRSTRRDHAD